MANSSPESVDVLETNRNKAAELAALWNEWNEDNFPGTPVHGIGDYKGQLKEFTDQHAEELRAAAESLPLHRIPTNSAATGQPTITGNAWVGETLTVDTSGIDDADGLSNVSFSYQWLSSTVTTDTDIAGATSYSYTLVAADVGKAIRVRVSFIDEANNQESLTSDATAAVAAAAPAPGPITGFPVVDASDQSLEGALADGGTLALDDPDGGSFGIRADLESGATIGSMRLQLTGAKTHYQTENITPYSLYGDSGGNLNGESLPVGEYTLTATAYFEARLGGNVLGALKVSFSVTETATQQTNSPATGTPTISGTAQVGETLTVDTSGIDDADGLTGASFSYQWLANDAEITGAMSDSYTLVDAACTHCDSALWQADNSGPRRYPLADYVKHRMKNFFGLLIGDEVHEFKGRGAAQGIAAGVLADACGKSFTLTGTLTGGYSSTLFHLLYRFSPEIRTEFGRSDEHRWIQRYGFEEHSIGKRDDDAVEDGRYSRRRKYRKVVRERPGLVPSALFHLIGNTVFLRLSDVAAGLPPYEEQVMLSSMDSEEDATGYSQRKAYDTVFDKLRRELAEALKKGSKRLLATYLQTLLAYPDGCTRGETVFDPRRRKYHRAGASPVGGETLPQGEGPPRPRGGGADGGEKGAGLRHPHRNQGRHREDGRLPYAARLQGGGDEGGRRGPGPQRGVGRR